MPLIARHSQVARHFGASVRAIGHMGTLGLFYSLSMLLSCRGARLAACTRGFQTIAGRATAADTSAHCRKLHPSMTAVASNLGWHVARLGFGGEDGSGLMRRQLNASISQAIEARTNVFHVSAGECARLMQQRDSEREPSPLAAIPMAMQSSTLPRSGVIICADVRIRTQRSLSSQAATAAVAPHHRQCSPKAAGAR